MIGNDIIDLSIPVSKKWNNKRYLDKLFDLEEQAIIKESENSKIIMLLLWSLKEATYKAHQRRFNLPRKYNPLAFHCKLTSRDQSRSQGSVEIEKYTYFTSSIINSAFIHSVASFETESVASQKIYGSNKNAYEVILKDFSLLLKEPIANLKIEKDKNLIPILVGDVLKLEHAFSTSHHGNYAAYVIALMNS